MNSIQLENFKAFLDPVHLSFGGKNALIYGENGTGKSSVYEAIKLLFYTSKVFNNRLDPSLSNPQDIQNAKNDILDSYNHQSRINTRFSLVFNGTTYSGALIAGYSVNMISRSDIKNTNKIRVSDLLNTSLVGISDVNNFITNNKDDIEIFLNETLKKNFYENSISIELFYLSSEWLLKVKDNARGIQRTDELDSYFNEGKLHIIIITLLLIVVQLIEPINRGNKLVLVLDDIITSLDAANRTLFIKYLKEYFESYQKIILTHSISFYNQLNYSFRIVWKQEHNWKLFNIVQYYNKSIIEEENRLISANKLRAQFNRNRSLPSLQNDIRKCFEYQVLEFSKLFYIGGVSECGKILKNINTLSSLYYKYDAVNNKYCTIYNMIDEIMTKTRSSAACTLKTDIETIVNDYSAYRELPKLQETIKELMIYQKVTMHAGSHASGALSPFTQQEIDRSITLLQYLDKLINELVGRDLYSI